MALNETHDTSLQSWVASANTGKSDFPIQNLPFAVFRRTGSSEAFRGGVAIGDQVLDMAAVRDAKALPADVQAQVDAAAQGKLNALMGMNPAQWSALRLALSRALRAGAAAEAALQSCLVPQSEVEYAVPVPRKKPHSRPAWCPSPKSNTPCPCKWATTRTSTPPSITPPMWASCFAPPTR